MIYLRQILAILWKDILAELRTKEIFSAMLMFGLLVIVVFNFAFEPSSEEALNLAPGLLWIAVSFAGVLGLNRSFSSETRMNALQGLMLAPLDRGAIYLGKMLGNLLFMGIADLVILACFAVLYNLSVLPSLGMVLLILFLGTAGFAIVGTLFSAVAINTRMSEVMLPILQLPISVPLLIASIQATAAAINPQPGSNIGDWIKILVVFDVVFGVVCWLLFQYVIEE
jgi:heme exporter protein B